MDYSKELSKEAVSLGPEHNSCIIGTSNGLLVYSKSLLLNSLYEQCLKEIKSGQVQSEEESKEAQAYFMALEIYYKNYECVYLGSPIIKDDLDDD